MNSAQSQTANDVCTCRGCNVEQPVTIIPDLPVNKWTCRNCNLLQVWKPSESFNRVHEVVSRNPFPQGSLFNAGPFVGLGADGCLSGVFPDPSQTNTIFLAAAGIAIIATLIEYYRVCYGSVAMLGDSHLPRQKASNKVSGVDNWNRQPPISILSLTKEVSVMSKAQSSAKDNRKRGSLIPSLSKSFQKKIKPSIFTKL